MVFMRKYYSVFNRGDAPGTSAVGFGRAKRAVEPVQPVGIINTRRQLAGKGKLAAKEKAGPIVVATREMTPSEAKKMGVPVHKSSHGTSTFGDAWVGRGGIMEHNNGGEFEGFAGKGGGGNWALRREDR